MSVRSTILQRLEQSQNGAVERAIEAALLDARPSEQHELAEVLLTRNRRPGWVALIRAFHRLDSGIQEKLLSRPRDLFGPLSETMQDIDGPARENVIAIVERCTDVRLVYLLAEALSDNRPEVRQMAANSLLAAVRRQWESARKGAAEDSPASPADLEQFRRAVDVAVKHFKNHRQTPALLAALIHERQQDAPLWLLFQDPYDDRTRSATILLRAPAEPALAVPLLLALGTALKPAAMAGLASVEARDIALAIADQSFRLLDPSLRDGARGVNHLKMLPAVRKEPPWNISCWAAWLRLIELVGLQAVERLNWLKRLLESAPAAPEACAWKISVSRAIAETHLPDAAAALIALVRDPDERVARFAARLLIDRKHPEWRERAGTVFPASPHLSVRRMSLLLRGREVETPAANRPHAVTGFEKAWHDYQRMPPAVQLNTARSMATDVSQADQLRAKLQGSAQEIAQGLKMVSSLPSLTPFRNQLIALCGHADVRIAALAVRLIARLEDPKLKDLLEAAAKHPDGRVRANAVESMDDLQIAHRSQEVLTMLNSRHNRERANAIKAFGQFNFATARECLARMLTDGNPLHRMSALWVVEQLNVLEMMRQVSSIARRDPNLRVRKKASEMLETLSGNVAGHH